MFMKSLIAAATVAAGIAMIPASQANAKTNVDVDVYLGGGGWGPGYGYGWGGGYYPAYKGISCWKGKNVVKWAGFKNVHAFDCGKPVYQYKAWKFGNPYRVRVNMAGNIVGVKKL